MSRSYWAEPRRLCPRRLTGCGKTREPGLRQPGSSRCASCEGSFPWFTNVRGTPSSGAAGEPKDDSNQTWKVIRASRVAAERPSSLVRSSRFDPRAPLSAPCDPHRPTVAMKNSVALAGRPRSTLVSSRVRTIMGLREHLHGVDTVNPA